MLTVVVGVEQELSETHMETFKKDFFCETASFP